MKVKIRASTLASTNHIISVRHITPQINFNILSPQNDMPSIHTPAILWQAPQAAKYLQAGVGLQLAQKQHVGLALHIVENEPHQKQRK